MLAYLCATTPNLKSGSGVPVLINGPARGSGPSKLIGKCTSHPSCDCQRTNLYVASAPSLQLAVDMLSDLADGVQDVANGYEEAVERAANGSLGVEEAAQPASLLIKSNLLFSESHLRDPGVPN